MKPATQNGVTLVTGAAGALGSCVARMLSAAGYEVCGIDLSPIPSGTGIHNRSGIDLSSYEATRDTVAGISNEYGQISNIVNIAGGFAWETIGEGSVETWQKMWTLNLQTALNVSKAGLEDLKSARGCLVNIGAAAALQADLGMGAYAASKAAVERLTQSLAKELRPVGARANAILPSIIDTPANRAAMPDADWNDWIPPQDIAELVGFLLSDSARCINGASIPITRGA